MVDPLIDQAIAEFDTAVDALTADMAQRIHERGYEQAVTKFAMTFDDALYGKSAVAAIAAVALARLALR